MDWVWLLVVGVGGLVVVSFAIVGGLFCYTLFGLMVTIGGRVDSIDVCMLLYCIVFIFLFDWLLLCIVSICGFWGVGFGCGLLTGGGFGFVGIVVFVGWVVLGWFWVVLGGFAGGFAGGFGV